MGIIDLDSFQFLFDDIHKLNREPELLTLGLEFQIIDENYFVSGKAEGNVSNYRIIFSKIRVHLLSGSLTGTLTESGKNTVNVTITVENVIVNNVVL